MNNKPNYAFIDSQNLNIGIQSQGWKLDWGKFRLYLKNKYGVDKAYLFIGQLAGQESLYGDDAAAAVVRRRHDRDRLLRNVDAELVLYASAKTYRHYNQAIIVSGDGDFYCLAEYLKDQGKLGSILVPNQKFSKSLKDFDTYIKRIDHAKKSLMLHEHKKDQD